MHTYGPEGSGQTNGPKLGAVLGDLLIDADGPPPPISGDVALSDEAA